MLDLLEKYDIIISKIGLKKQKINLLLKRNRKYSSLYSDFDLLFENQLKNQSNEFQFNKDSLISSLKDFSSDIFDINREIIYMVFNQVMNKFKISLDKFCSSLAGILETYSEDQVEIFSYWLFTGIASFEDQSLIIEIINTLFENLNIDLSSEAFVKLRTLSRDLRRLYKDEISKDFNIGIENFEVLKAHRLILFTRSGLFRNMFGTSCSHDTSNFAKDFSGLDSFAFKAFIYFLYHNRLPDDYIGNFDELYEFLFINGNYFQLNSKI